MKFYVHLHRVLPESMCEAIIEAAEVVGFEQAYVNNYGTHERLPSVRNNDRVNLIDPPLAAQLGNLLRMACLERFPTEIDSEKYAFTGDNFRVYRYVPGQFFKPHRDGDVQSGRAISKVTVLVYLNDAQGGETILMPTGYAYKDDWITIQPRTGDVLMFSHDFWHEGKPVSASVKYVLRTDFFYGLNDIVGQGPDVGDLPRQFSA